MLDVISNAEAKWRKSGRCPRAQEMRPEHAYVNLEFIDSKAWIYGHKGNEIEFIAKGLPLDSQDAIIAASRAAEERGIDLVLVPN